MGAELERVPVTARIHNVVRLVLLKGPARQSTVVLSLELKWDSVLVCILGSCFG